jgi:hypothetical protein
VRNRGKIKTDEQFRLLKGRHEQIWDDPSHSEEANALAALLDQYEARKVRRKAPPNNGLQQTWPSLRSVHAAETWYVRRARVQRSWPRAAASGQLSACLRCERC